MRIPWFRRGRHRTAEEAFANEVADYVHALLGVEASPLPGFVLNIPRPGGGSVAFSLQSLYEEVQGLSGEARRAWLRTAVLVALIRSP